MGYSFLDAPDYGEPTSYMDGSSGYQPQGGQPSRPSFFQAFQGGMQQNPRKNKLLAGLAGQAGSGGAMGTLGNVAQFLL